MPNIFTYHLARLFQFSGRENRKLFWPWVAVVMMLYGVIFGIVMIAAMVAMMAAVSPAITFESTMAPVMWGHCAVAAVMVALLAAAIVRRLHDANRSALWAFLPLPFLSIGMVGFPLYMPSHMGPDPNFGVFGLLFLNNIVYLAVLFVLAVLLTRPGTKGENKYGPQPAPTPIISITQDI